MRDVGKLVWAETQIDTVVFLTGDGHRTCRISDCPITIERSGDTASLNARGKESPIPAVEQQAAWQRPHNRAVQVHDCRDVGLVKVAEDVGKMSRGRGNHAGSCLSGPSEQFDVLNEQLLSSLGLPGRGHWGHLR